MEAESQSIASIQSQLLTLIPIAAIFSAIITLIIRGLNEKRAKLERTIKLHESFLHPDFYEKVRAPSFRVSIQWFHLPEETREMYKRAVCSGWSKQFGIDELKFYAPNFPRTEDEIIEYHFQNVKNEKGLTEHQSLTSILRFWTRINIYRKKKLLNNRLLSELFIDEFRYQHQFLIDLVNALNDEMSEPPQWVIAITELSIFFKLETKPNNR